MTRELLIKEICPNAYINNCRFLGCSQCDVKLNELLDEYDKQIRADAINEFVYHIKEHHYVLSDVINSTDYGMFTVGIEQIAEELKEKNK